MVDKLRTGDLELSGDITNIGGGTTILETAIGELKLNSSNKLSLNFNWLTTDAAAIFLALELEDNQEDTTDTGHNIGHGFGFVSFVSANTVYNDTQEYAVFTYSTASGGAITVADIHSSTNIVYNSGATEDAFNIYGAATKLHFENRLGADSGTPGEGFVVLFNNELKEGS